jgi:hypothetical protein
VDLAQADMKTRICLVVTSEVTVRAFLLDHLRALEQHRLWTILMFQVRKEPEAA